ncbi:MAG: ATP-binding protein [Pseudomonadota bacterium]
MMKRWIFVPAFGIALGLMVSWIDFPFQGLFYNLMMRVRGVQPVDPAIVLAMLPTSDSPVETEDSWVLPLHQFLLKLKSRNPRAVVLDFHLDGPERELLKPDELPYPVLWNREIPRRSAEPRVLRLIASPGSGEFWESSLSGKGSSFGSFDSHLISLIAPDKVAKLSPERLYLINVAGPPGTYRRIEIEEALRSALTLQELSGSLILIPPPPSRQHAYLGGAPFYSRRGSVGASATELDANAIDSLLRDRFIRVSRARVTIAMTILVSIVTTAGLFSPVPLLGILTVIFVLAGLVLVGVIGLSHFIYLDISRPIFAIAIAYYFLLPYRLIVEYKGRWRYQEEARLLSEVETLKDNFMSLVSHNLKTPIARIQGIVEMLLAAKEQNPKNLRLELEKILRSGEDLHRFVSRILTLTRVERPEFQLKMANKDVNAMIERLVEAHRSSAIDKHVAIKTKLEPLFPLLMDGDLIQESAANLIENAVKYTPAGGTVEISTSESGSWVKIDVADSGPGIRPEDRERIFQKFYRGQEARNQGVRGSGLGLYLVKYFVGLHGGLVSVGDREGGGSVFSIQLPRK